MQINSSLVDKIKWLIRMQKNGKDVNHYVGGVKLIL
jgi:hypothetical protein